jgi:hypothetical protein
MPLPEESIIGHKEQLLDPERQIVFFRKCLRGEKTPYNTPALVVWAARNAIEKAINIVYPSGIQKGYRKYNDSEIRQMRDEMKRLEKLLERKNKGENIEREIDGPASEAETDEEKKEPETDKKAEPSPDAPEIAEIKALIDEAVGYYSDGVITEANELFGKAIKAIEKARESGVDVKGLEIEIGSLQTFFKTDDLK